MSKDTRIPIRVSHELKAAFEERARAEGISVSAWLRGLGELELEEHPANGVAPATETPPVSAFIPGLGMEDTDG